MYHTDGKKAEQLDGEPSASVSRGVGGSLLHFTPSMQRKK